MTCVPPLKVLIAHDEPLVRAGLEATFQRCADFEITTAPVADDADVVLADCENGVRIARSEVGNRLRVVIVTQDESEVSIRRAIEAGVRGYLLLGTTLQSIVHAVHCVAGGGTALDPIVATRMMESLNGNRLTRRELEVLSLLMLGLSDKAIAHRLGISPGTSRCHVKRLLTKLDARSRTEAIAIARRRGLVPDARQKMTRDGWPQLVQNRRRCASLGTPEGAKLECDSLHAL